MAIHAGRQSDPVTGSCAAPVYRTAAYDFGDSQNASDLFALKKSGNIYSRLTNPTNDALERRLAALDGGVGALSFASGTAAIYFSLTNIARMGDEIVSASNLYGGTFTQFDALLPQQGIMVRFTPLNDFDAVRSAVTEKTRALYVETVGNPGLRIADLERYASVAQEFHLPLVVDSTFTPPSLLRPIEYGANIVIHSLSKWIGGHGTGIGGAVIDAGTFDWSDTKFTLYSEPDRGYHGLRFGHDLGEQNPLAFLVRLRTVALRNQGATLSPDAAWLFLLGTETLPLRMKRHSDNALAVARFLTTHPAVAWVNYPGLNDPLAQKYLPNGAGGMVTFGLRILSNRLETADAARRFTDRLRLFKIVANVGEAESLVIHPASTTHSQLDEKGLELAGIRPEMIRLSIGLEHPDDLIEALSDALEEDVKP